MFGVSSAFQAVQETKEKSLSITSQTSFKGAVLVGLTSIFVTYFVKKRFQKSVEMETLDCDDDDEWLDDDEDIPADKNE